MDAEYSLPSSHCQWHMSRSGLIVSKFFRPISEKRTLNLRPNFRRGLPN